MNVEQVREWLSAGQVQAVESALLEAIQQGAPASELAAALEELVKAGQLDTAEAIALMAAEQQESAGPQDRLTQLQALACAVPDSADLRNLAAELYRQIHADNPHLDDLMKLSGLVSKQSPRRALRTLDTCLSAQPGRYLVSRYEGHALRVERFEPATGEFEVTDPTGRRHRIEAKALADECDGAEDNDFRVVSRFDPQEMARLLRDDPAAVLVGICRTTGGSISATALRDLLTPKMLPAEEWTSWWNAARTAAKRCPRLSLEGRSPIVVRYHPGGLSLEDELADAVREARMPLERLALLQQYLREARLRKLQPRQAFIDAQMEAMVQQARQYVQRRPSDALGAALAIESTMGMGLSCPSGECPKAADVLRAVSDPAEAVAGLAGSALWPAALQTLSTLPDAAGVMASIWDRAGRGDLDDLSGWLNRLGEAQTVEQAVAASLANPAEHLQTCLWLWKGPAQPPANMPRRTELLGKLLGEVQRVERERETDPAAYKSVTGSVREALRAGDYASFRQAVGEMDEHVAAAVKRQIERTDGLAQAVGDQTLAILRETFFGLFVSARQKVEPWLDEDVIYTSAEALERRKEELRVLNDVTLPANSRAIGEAAGHGDLSENSEWKFAREERANLLARAAKMQEELLKARVVDPQDVPADTVGIGSRVALRRADGSTVRLSILGPWETDVEKRVYNYQTPLARGLLGSAIGQEVTFRLDGQEETFRIEALEPAVT